MSCGARKTVNGGTTLVCNLEANHEDLHGMRWTAGAPPYVVWGDAVQWTADDAARLVERHTWSKGHVRRPYQTAAMWKAERGL